MPFQDTARPYRDLEHASAGIVDHFPHRNFLSRSMLAIELYISFEDHRLFLIPDLNVGRDESGKYD